jgi:hypothetical protein
MTSVLPVSSHHDLENWSSFDRLLDQNMPLARTGSGAGNQPINTGGTEHKASAPVAAAPAAPAYVPPHRRGNQVSPQAASAPGTIKLSLGATLEPDTTRPASNFQFLLGLIYQQKRLNEDKKAGNPIVHHPIVVVSKLIGSNTDLQQVRDPQHVIIINQILKFQSETPKYSKMASNKVSPKAATEFFYGLEERAAATTNAQAQPVKAVQGRGDRPTAEAQHALAPPPGLPKPKPHEVFGPSGFSDEPARGAISSNAGRYVVPARRPVSQDAVDKAGAQTMAKAEPEIKEYTTDGFIKEYLDEKTIAFVKDIFAESKDQASFIENTDKGISNILERKLEGHEEIENYREPAIALYNYFIEERKSDNNLDADRFMTEIAERYKEIAGK